MLQTVISSLIVAGVTGLTFIAYKHPRGYARIFPYLIGAIIATCFGIMIWDSGVSAAHSALMTIIPIGAAKEARDAINHISVSIWWVFIGFWAGFLYATGLYFLHEILGIDKKRKSNHPNDTRDPS